MVIAQALWPAVAVGQMNSWTKSTSGYWEEPYWSLGVLPSSNHVVEFGSPGWRVLAIGAGTRSFPESLTISDLTVTAPADTVNLFLLSYAGVDAPLRVLHTFTLGTNSRVLTLGSRLEVLEAFLIGGTVNFGESSELFAQNLELGHSTAGTLNMTNGTVSAGRMVMGRDAKGVFNQEGGTNFTLVMEMRGLQSTYALQGGAYVGDSMAVGTGYGNQTEASFIQQDGNLTLHSNLDLGVTDATGHYVLARGNLRARSLTVGLYGGSMYPQSTGTFLHLDGTNTTTTLTVGNNVRGGVYTLSNGVVNTELTWLGGAAGGPAIFTQGGGVHTVNGPLILSGSYGRDFASRFATYVLQGGNLSEANLDMTVAKFFQSGGSHQIAGALRLLESFNGSTYSLSNGVLAVADLTVTGGGFIPGTFQQSGGSNFISNRLEIGAPLETGVYALTGGDLVVKEILLKPQGTLRVAGGRLFHQSLFRFAGGRLEVQTPAQQFGPLQLETNSTIAFSTPPTVLRFADSHEVVLPPAGTLYITNWHGLTNGGGAQQLIFGTDSGAWTPGQLARTRFQNPAGFAPGSYPARILSCGEVVPLNSPVLEFSRTPEGLALSWEGSFVLQTATNLAGPYEDLREEQSPCTRRNTAEPQRFFRLRR